MRQEFNKVYVEEVLRLLDDQSYLFPQFALTKVNNELKLLGSGGFSMVYEMYNKQRPDMTFAIKITGFQQNTVSTVEFWNANRIQWILAQESNYILRLLDARELVLVLDVEGEIKEVKDTTKEVWEETEKALHLQFVLMEKLEELIKKDRFSKVRLYREVLCSESEVLKLAFEIGQGISSAHTNRCLHRDIKIENIFWDESEKVYKLGDFGIAKWAESGNAETIVYTDGYGAPEIERRLYDSYNATADIYSFGITLYLLLNDLKFPGSDGYYSKVEVQYNPDFIFPAPKNASESVARVIRKMCSFYSVDRYQSMNEVLTELSVVLDAGEIEASDELYELADIATETFKKENVEESNDEELVERKKTRAERIEEQQIVDMLYREDSTKYFIMITVLLVLLLKGMQWDVSMVTNWMFLILPVAALLEALLQNLKDFHLFFGTVLLTFVAFSICSVGITMPHIILILCILIGCPVLTLAGAISIGLWMLIVVSGKLIFLDNLIRLDCGWIFLTILLLVVHRYFHMRIEWEKTTYVRAFLGKYMYDKIMLAMIIVGFILFVLQKNNVIIVPDIIEHIHLVRTGIISFGVIHLFSWWDSELDRNDRISEKEKT